MKVGSVLVQIKAFVMQMESIVGGTLVLEHLSGALRARTEYRAQWQRQLCPRPEQHTLVPYLSPFHVADDVVGRVGSSCTKLLLLYGLVQAANHVLSTVIQRPKNIPRRQSQMKCRAFSPPPFSVDFD